VKIRGLILTSSIPAMAVSPLTLLVIVIRRAGACSGARTDECALPTTNQCTCSGTDGCPNADALRGLLFAGLRVSIMPVLSARNWYRECEREH
jgi:hypothetical protein